MTTPAPGHITRAWLARQGLHIYGQAMWHEEVWIVGSRDSLQALRYAIANAILDRHGEHLFYVNDGEGYEVHVICEDIDQRHAVPYSDNIAHELRDDARPPWKAAMEKGWRPNGPA